MTNLKIFFGQCGRSLNITIRDVSVQDRIVQGRNIMANLGFSYVLLEPLVLDGQMFIRVSRFWNYNGNIAYRLGVKYVKISGKMLKLVLIKRPIARRS
jgi:hypothetical protein